jgi:hypothetical protein
MQITDEKLPNFYDNNEREIIQASYDSLWNWKLNGKIQEDTIVKAYVTLECYGLLPKNTWFQGERAMREAGFLVRRETRSLLKSLKQLDSAKTSKKTYG